MKYIIKHTKIQKIHNTLTAKNIFFCYNFTKFSFNILNILMIGSNEYSKENYIF